MANPIQLFEQDWQEARRTNDANAHYCTLATVSDTGQASLRTLVLRHFAKGQFSLFINRSSPKWKDITEHSGSELLIFWPSLMIQYRIRGKVHILPDEAMQRHWQCKPYESKLLDTYYAQYHSQSSSVASRDEILEGIESLREKFPDGAMIPYPDNVAGIGIAPTYMERWQNDQQTRLHDRVLYEKVADGWSSQVLTP